MEKLNLFVIIFNHIRHRLLAFQEAQTRSQRCGRSECAEHALQPQDEINYVAKPEIALSSLPQSIPLFSPLHHKSSQI